MLESLLRAKSPELGESAIIHSKPVSATPCHVTTGTPAPACVGVIERELD